MATPSQFTVEPNIRSFQEAYQLYFNRHCGSQHVLPKGVIFPAIFKMKNPQLVDQDIDQRRTDLRPFRKGDNVELALHRSLQLLGHVTEDRFVALMNFNMDTLKNSTLRNVLGDSTMHQLVTTYNSRYQPVKERNSQDQQKVLFEADTILVHEKIGIVLFECKGGKKLGTEVNQQHDRSMSFVKAVIDVLHSKHASHMVSFHKVVVATNAEKGYPATKTERPFITKSDVDKNSGCITTWLTRYLSTLQKCEYTIANYEAMAALLVGVSTLCPVRIASNTSPISQKTAYQLKNAFSEYLETDVVESLVCNTDKTNDKSQLVPSKLVNHCPINLLSHDQVSILSSPNNHIIIKGPAGSGKSICIISKVMELISNETNHLSTKKSLTALTSQHSMDKSGKDKSCVSKCSSTAKITIVGCRENIRRIRNILINNNLDISSVQFIDSRAFADIVFDVLHPKGNSIIAEYPGYHTIFELAEAAENEDYSTFQQLAKIKLSDLIPSINLVRLLDLPLDFGHLFIDDSFRNFREAYITLLVTTLYRYQHSSEIIWVVSDVNQIKQRRDSHMFELETTLVTFYNRFMEANKDIVMECNSVMRYTETVYRELFEPQSSTRYTDYQYPYFYRQTQPATKHPIVHRKQGAEPFNLCFKLNTSQYLRNSDSYANFVSEKATQIVTNLITDVPPHCIAVIVLRTVQGDASTFLSKDLVKVQEFLARKNVVSTVLNETSPIDIDERERGVCVCFDQDAYSSEWHVVIFIDTCRYAAKSKVEERLPRNYLGKSRCTTFLISLSFYGSAELVLYKEPVSQ